MEARRRTSAVIALTALMAVTAQALGPEPHYSGQAAVKVNFSKNEIGWPFEYKALDLCVIPVYMEIGYYVEVGWPVEEYVVIDPNDPNEPNDVDFDVNDIVVGDAWETWRLDLRQVDCGDIGKNTETDWPCFHDCQEIKIRANFDVKLSATLYKTSDLVEEWEAYFEGSDIVPGSGEWETAKVCVIAWRARLLKEMSATKVKVGELTVTVKPKV